MAFHPSLFHLPFQFDVFVAHSLDIKSASALLSKVWLCYISVLVYSIPFHACHMWDSAPDSEELGLGESD